MREFELEELWRASLYLLLILFMFLVATLIGWFGASLTFPIEKPETQNQ